ncbi:hypothetical protein BC941DRAFT_443011 [Chlamydoabsidia padenii]|nr:hypothetical protein BC941DRAFT_443011 [Chlamydoabsidia padenii]
MLVESIYFFCFVLYMPNTCALSEVMMTFGCLRVPSASLLVAFVKGRRNKQMVKEDIKQLVIICVAKLAVLLPLTKNLHGLFTTLPPALKSVSMEYTYLIIFTFSIVSLV